MSRRSLKEIQAGRDPLLFAYNVRRRRETMGLSQRQLAKVASVDHATLVNINKGNGCTPLVERKLSAALMVAVGTLWVEVPARLTRRLITDPRWHFSDRENCRKYLLVHGLLAKDEDFRQDPDAIQSEQERLRLGRNGLSDGFLLITSSNLVHHSIASALHECYARGYDPPDPGAVSCHYCLRGALKYTFDEETIILAEGQTLSFEPKSGFVTEPLVPVGPHDLPPLVSIVNSTPWPPKKTRF